MKNNFEKKIGNKKILAINRVYNFNIIFELNLKSYNYI